MHSNCRISYLIFQSIPQFRLRGNSRTLHFVHCFAFTRSAPFSNVLIFCWFFMRIKDIGSLSTQTSFTTKLRGVFRTQSNIYDGVFCGNSWRVSVLLRCLTGFWDASLKLSGSCCLLKPNYWNFNSNIL